MPSVFFPLFDEWMQLQLVHCFSVWHLHVLSVDIIWHLLMLCTALRITIFVLFE